MMLSSAKLSVNSVLTNIKVGGLFLSSPLAPINWGRQDGSSFPLFRVVTIGVSLYQQKKVTAIDKYLVIASYT